MYRYLSQLIIAFLLLLLSYHGIFARVNFGSGREIKDRIVPLTRDALWLAIVAIALCTRLFQSPKQLRYWIKKQKFLVVAIVLFTLYASLLSWGYHSSAFTDILAGIKSSIFPFMILLSAGFVGAYLSAKTPQGKKEKLMTILLRIIVAGGLLRQGAKHLFPELFYSLGYGPVGDWVPGVAPPLYYRTGPGGVPRLSGLFAGPNNYAYVLIMFFPVILRYLKDLIPTIRKNFSRTKLPLLLLCILFVLSGILTLSRGLIVAWGLQVLIFFSLSIRSFVKRHKGRSIASISIVLLGFIGLSIYKAGSSIEHLQRRKEGFLYLREQPRRGYGLGASGPGIHHGGLVLPENTYLQILLDTGIFGFAIRALILFIYLKPLYTKRKQQQQRTTQELFPLGLLGLLATGMFLHIFEDGMVNYLVFVLRGIYSPPQEEGE